MDDNANKTDPPVSVIKIYIKIKCKNDDNFVTFKGKMYTIHAYC